ncbi:MAG: YifB family Mg chelatase-like AAA ATPase [Alphaproteobacteria bacterium]
MTAPITITRCVTVAFSGISAQMVEVQVSIASGLPAFSMVGLPDKAVAESRERVRAALTAMGLALPAKRITVNLAPADMAKEGSHFDLPIALTLMTAMGALPEDALEGYLAIGELGLDGALRAVTGVLPAAMKAHEMGIGVICPGASGPEAAWAGDDLEILAADRLSDIVDHFRGESLLPRPKPEIETSGGMPPDLRDIKGQESAKRAIEVAAAGGHNVLMIGPPGSGKSMLAARMPGILPPLSPAEALEVSMIHSIAGQLEGGRLLRFRPYRDPHHSASLPALVGGGTKARPGEISLAHNGVLFLDELPEFSRQTLEALRQPVETGQVSISRVQNFVTYPARFQLVAAMNPCRCGHLDDPDRACSRAPRCAADYQAKISGPMIDRMDIVIDVPAVTAQDLSLPPAAEGSAEVAERIARARTMQQERFARLTDNDPNAPRINAAAEGRLLEEIATPDADGASLLTEAASTLKLSARGYHRVLRVARTLADLAADDQINRSHIAEALSYRRLG